MRYGPRSTVSQDENACGMTGCTCSQKLCKRADDSVGSDVAICTAPDRWGFWKGWVPPLVPMWLNTPLPSKGLSQ